MKIATFIFNWRGQYEKTREKELKLTELGKNPIVINSDDNFMHDHWHNIGEASYFTDQFLKALEVFDTLDADVLFHVQADASYDNWEKLYADAEKYYEACDWGIYAPNVDYTWYDSSRTDVSTLQFELDDCRMVANTDCTCWFIHRDIINKFKERNLDFKPYKMGWCWDIIFPALAYINKRPVIRDYGHTISHPQGTNYDTNQAEREMWDLFQSLPKDLQQAFGLIKGNRQYLCKYYEENNSVQSVG